jgi:hypothetical protein
MCPTQHLESPDCGGSGPHDRVKMASMLVIAMFTHATHCHASSWECYPRGIAPIFFVHGFKVDQYIVGALFVLFCVTHDARPDIEHEVTD